MLTDDEVRTLISAAMSRLRVLVRFVRPATRRRVAGFLCVWIDRQTICLALARSKMMASPRRMRSFFVKVRSNYRGLSGKLGH